VSENCRAAVPFPPDHPGPSNRLGDPASGSLPERRPVRPGPSVARRGKIGVRGIRRQPLPGPRLLVAEVSSRGGGVDVPVGAVDLLDDEAEQGRDGGLQRDLAGSWWAGRQLMGNRAHARRPGVEAAGGGEEDGDGRVAQVR
jgi:hypothetical protein